MLYLLSYTPIGCYFILFSSKKCRIAQWKRAGLITQRSGDRNLVLLFFNRFDWAKYFLLGSKLSFCYFSCKHSLLVITLLKVVAPKRAVVCSDVVGFKLATAAIDKTNEFLVWDSGEKVSRDDRSLIVNQTPWQ